MTSMPLRAALRHVASTKITATALRSIGTFSQTAPLKEKMTMKVPTMGDSITEGSIVEWAVNVGEAVKVDDVIVLIETDKVTIDIKAETDGVIVQQFGGIDDTVEVGANLYEIDTEGVAVATATDEPSAPVEETPAEAAAATPTASASATTDDSSTKTTVRIPSIKFLKKEGWMRRKSGLADVQPESTTTGPTKPHHTVTLDSSPLSPTYGRLPFTEKEIQALLLGGANEAPDMKW